MRTLIGQWAIKHDRRGKICAGAVRINIIGSAQQKIQYHPFITLHLFALQSLHFSIHYGCKRCNLSRINYRTTRTYEASDSKSSMSFQSFSLVRRLFYSVARPSNDIYSLGTVIVLKQDNFIELQRSQLSKEMLAALR